jgi:hypothetical protein
VSQGFQPEYLFEDELEAFGVPNSTQLPTIMTLVDAASTLIDEYCGRIDGSGAGSLVYTTYRQRILLPGGRNIIQVAYTPLVAVSALTVAALQASASGGPESPDNNFYTGVKPNTVFKNDGTLTQLVSASGRYGYGRRDMQNVAPDLNYGANILQVAAFFGGPPQWTPIDISMVDVAEQIGQLWVPAGLYMAQYTEVIIEYNSGYDPRNMPRAIKHACAALVKNFIARGGGVTSITNYSAGKIHASFTQALIDPTIELFLNSYKKVTCI